MRKIFSHWRLEPVYAVGSTSDYRSRGRKFKIELGHITFVEIDDEIFSTVILSIPLIQEVTGKSVCSKY